MIKHSAGFPAVINKLVPCFKRLDFYSDVKTSLSWHTLFITQHAFAYLIANTPEAFGVLTSSTFQITSLFREVLKCSSIYSDLRKDL